MQRKSGKEPGSLLQRLGVRVALGIFPQMQFHAKLIAVHHDYGYDKNGPLLRGACQEPRLVCVYQDNSSAFAKGFRADPAA